LQEVHVKTVISSTALFLLTATASASSLPYPAAAVLAQNTNHQAAPPNVTRLQGSAAMAHVEEIQSKHPAAFRKAVEELKKRGFRPTEQALGMVHSGQAKGVSFPPNGIQLVQTSWSGDQGEIDWWSWDDGYDGTWEGVLYAENYSTGVSATFDLQINIETDGNYWTVFEDCTGVEYRDGGPKEVRAPQRSTSDTGIRLAATHNFIPQLLSTMHVNRVPGQPYALVAARGYYKCAFFWCLGAAVGCSFTGPAAPGCFMGGCTTAMIGCLAELF
jgi:hypothetical protein